MEKNTSVHTLSALVANTPGVLARIAQVFSRRGFNIDSLVVSPGKGGKFSRMTMTAVGAHDGLDQIIKQVNKLVDVVTCVEHTDKDVVSKELALIKVEADKGRRTEALQLAEHFGARSVDLTDQSVIFMITGDSGKIDAFFEMLNGFEIIELVRTGKVVMARGQGET